MCVKMEFLCIGTEAAILNYANERFKGKIEIVSNKISLPISLKKNHDKGDLPTMICSDPYKKAPYIIHYRPKRS